MDTRTLLPGRSRRTTSRSSAPTWTATSSSLSSHPTGWISATSTTGESEQIGGRNLLCDGAGEEIAARALAVRMPMAGTAGEADLHSWSAAGLKHLPVLSHGGPRSTRQLQSRMCSTIAAATMSRSARLLEAETDFYIISRCVYGFQTQFYENVPCLAGGTLSDMGLRQQMEEPP
jgi:hypothetical protein